MNKTITAILFTLILSMSVAFAAGSGSIWTTNGDCGDESQDVNHFNVGDVVYVNGANFEAAEEDWSITGNPGGSSCDPSIVVASGSILINESGNFCFAAYTVLPGDCGEYKVDVGKKNDNYRVNDEEPVETIPELTTIGAALVLGGAGLFMYRRKK